MRFALVAWIAGLVFAQNNATPPRTATQPAKSSLPAGQVAELVLANHILVNEGVLDAYGHVSVRDETNPQRFLLSRNLPPGEVTAADILEYDFDGKQEPPGPRTDYAERFIHAEIYRARPDVKAIVHTHSPDVIPFSVTGTKLLPVMHMAAFLGDGIPTFEIRTTGGMTDMLVKTPALGKALAATLGSKPAALMRGHGAVVIGAGLHEVVGRAYYMGVNARLQWQAIQLGGQVNYLEPEEARLTAPQDGFERAWAFWKSRVVLASSSK